MTKVCNGCKIEKPLTDFLFRLSGRGGGMPRSRCKLCERKAGRQRHRNNREHSNEKSRMWRVRNPEKRKQNLKNWVKNNPDKVRRLNIDSRPARRLRQKHKLETNPGFKITRALRRRVWDALKGRTKSCRTLELLGCSIDELRSWLSGWFQPGMTWENYGQWHIDHRRPCASFDLSDPEQQKRCFHYLNLQPLWAKDNMSKGAKITHY